MKLIIIVLLALGLVGCTDTTPVATPTPTIIPTPSTTTEVEKAIVDHKIEKADIVFDGLIDDGVGSILKDKVVMTENNQSGIAIVRDGNVYLQTSDGSHEVKIEGLTDVKGIAWHTDCGGNDNFSALHNDGTVSDFSVYLEDFKDPTSFIVSDIIKLELIDGFVTDIKGYDDTNPLTTCGGATFYYVLEDGSEVNGAGRKREDVHPYTGFIEFISGDLDIDAGIDTTDCLYIFEDGSIYKGKAQYGELVEFASIETYDEKLSYEGKDITVDKLSIYSDSNNNAYILASDGNLYIVDQEFNVTRFENASISYEGYDENDQLVEIAFSSDDGNVIVNTGYTLGKLRNHGQGIWFGIDHIEKAQ